MKTKIKNATCQRMNNNRDAILTLLDAERVQGMGTIPEDLMNEIRDHAEAATADSMIVINSVKDPLLRTALQLHYVDCLEWKDVAESMGSSEGQVSSLCSRFFRKLDTATK